MTNGLTEKQDNIAVFRSLRDISFISFPTRLEQMVLCVCTRGHISAIVDVESRQLSPSQVMVLRPGHRIAKCFESADFEGFFIVVSEKKLDQVLPSLHYLIPYSLHYTENPIIDITDDELDTLRIGYRVLNRHLKRYSDRPYASMSLAACCELLFYDVLSIYASRLNKGGRKTRREELLTDFIAILENNFRRERTVNFYADKLFVTPKHLSAVLKEVSGKTTGEWIDSRVILEAKLMLRSSGINIQEISAQLNFANQSFFGKYFKHLTGMSPRQYRASLPDL
ncbi:MAG: helix-turn-helix domain-containing protein [Duncaniella sp.]|nr:helix-turn-helix domain-containing protein [Duncaniella sp.]